MRLMGPMDKIKAYYSEKNGVRGIRYYRQDKMKPYGNKAATSTVWDLSEEKPVVGVYGNYHEEGIEKLGFIMLDTEC